MVRGTQERWSERVERWRESGLTAGEFSRKIGVSKATLYWWSSKLPSRREKTSLVRAAAPSPITFVEMPLRARRSPIEVILPSGHRLRLPSDFEAPAVERLLDVLEHRR
jgi:transposase